MRPSVQILDSFFPVSTSVVSCPWPLIEGGRRLCDGGWRLNDLLWCPIGQQSYQLNLSSKWKRLPGYIRYGRTPMPQQWWVVKWDA